MIKIFPESREDLGPGIVQSPNTTYGVVEEIFNIWPGMLNGDITLLPSLHSFISRNQETRVCFIGNEEKEGYTAIVNLILEILVACSNTRQCKSVFFDFKDVFPCTNMDLSVLHREQYVIELSGKKGSCVHGLDRLLKTNSPSVKSQFRLVNVVPVPGDTCCEILNPVDIKIEKIDVYELDSEFHVKNTQEEHGERLGKWLRSCKWNDLKLIIHESVMEDFLNVIHPPMWLNGIQGLKEVVTCVNRELLLKPMILFAALFNVQTSIGAVIDNISVSFRDHLSVHSVFMDVAGHGVMPYTHGVSFEGFCLMFDDLALSSYLNMWKEYGLKEPFAAPFEKILTRDKAIVLKRIGLFLKAVEFWCHAGLVLKKIPMLPVEVFRLIAGKFQKFVARFRL